MAVKLDTHSTPNEHNPNVVKTTQTAMTKFKNMQNHYYIMTAMWPLVTEDATHLRMHSGSEALKCENYRIKV